jgi:hypothetical protein
VSGARERLDDSRPTAAKLISYIWSEWTDAFETTMFEVNICASAGGREGYFNLSFAFPVSGGPGKYDPTGRVACNNLSHLQLVSIDESLKEATAGARLEEDIFRSFASVGSLVQGPPFAHPRREEGECLLDRTVDHDRLVNGHEARVDTHRRPSPLD